MRDKILAAIKQHEDDGWDPYGNHRDYSFDAEQAADAVMEVVREEIERMKSKIAELEKQLQEARDFLSPLLRDE